MSNSEYYIRQPEEEGEILEDDCLSRAESADTRSTVSHSNGSLRYQAELSSLYDVSHPPRFTYSPYAPPPHPSMTMNHYSYPFDYGFLPPPPFPSPASLSPSIPHQAQGICNCAQCLHTRRKYVETQAIPNTANKKELKTQASSSSGIMCCYHKRGVCKKGSDCWYSHDGNVDTPCHYGVKCVAGHGAYAKTALRGSSSIAAAIPLHTARAPPAPPTRHSSHPSQKVQKVSAPLRADVLEYVEDEECEFSAQPTPAPAPAPVKTTPKAKQNETIPEPPTLEGETCKYCEHDGLYVMPYRLYPGNGPSLLQYRIHCNACGGSWTPSSIVEEPTQEKRNTTRDQQVA
eukprot:PhF_6_TR13848/c1_g1_i1/m.22203